MVERRGQRDYPQAALCFALSLFGGVVIALQWHYHQTVNAVAIAWTGLTLVGVGLALRKK